MYCIFNLEMDKTTIYIAIIIVVICVLIRSHESFVVVTGPDGQLYQVLANDPQRSAEMLAWINHANVEFMRYLRDTYPTSEYTELLRKRYDPDVVGEHFPNSFAPETAFVQGKGDKIRFCLKEGKNPSTNSPYVDKNLMMFVNLHEMAHVASHEYGHGTGFWQAFKTLLIRAEEAGLYKPADFVDSSYVYCGLPITYNPYFDTNLGLC